MAAVPADQPSVELPLNHRLRLKIMGYIISQAICAAAELDIATKLADGPLTAAQLADATGAEPDALGRVMTTLTAEGLFTSDERGRYSLTQLGELLRGDLPGSLRHFSLQMGAEAYLAWSGALEAVCTGQPAFEEVFGAPYFDWLAAHPDRAVRFAQLQSDLVVRRLEPLRAVNWPPRGLVVDVGAGDGALLIELLAGRPGLTGIATDLPHVAEAARLRVAHAGLADRIRCVGGDFFHAIPGGGDFYILAEILHDWDDENASAILRQCRRAIPPHGRLLLLEQVIPDGQGQYPVRLLDLHMLIMLGGRERTREQWRALLDDSGFTLESVTAAERSCLLQATPQAVRAVKAGDKQPITTP